MRTRIAAAAVLLITLATPGVASADFQVPDLRARTQTLGADWAATSTVTPFGQTQRTATTADDDFDAIPLSNNAGQHATLNFSVSFDTNTGGKDTNPKRLEITLPPGMIGNPLTAAKCPLATYDNLSRTSTQCPTNTQVGYLGAQADGTNLGPQYPLPNGGQDALGTIYNLETRGDEVARLGAMVDLDTTVLAPAYGFERLKIPVLISVRTGSDYAIKNVQDPLPRNIHTYSVSTHAIRFTIFGKTPSNPATHLPLAGATPFLTNPTSCEPKQFSVTATDFIGESDSATYPYQATNCASVPFAPTIDVTNDNQNASQPAGYDFDISYPNYNVNANIYESHLRRAVVTLPDGVTLATGAARKLDSCSDEQMGFGNEDPPACPAESDIGDLSVTSPAVDTDPSDPDLDPLGGEVYFGKPLANDRWRIFQYIRGAGLRIKLKGSAALDAQTGRVTTTFDNLPEVPFTGFKLKLRGGSEGVLRNPETCGTHKAEIDLYPWSGGAPVHVEPQVTINAACPPDPAPFNPTISAAVTPTQAGANTKLGLHIVDPDQNQLLSGLKISLPAGLIGGLTGTELCSTGDAAAGTCGQASKIGTVAAQVGTGDDNAVTFPGSIYLARPIVAGDPASLSVVIPAKVGPIDLGNVVNQTRVILRPGDQGLDNLTAPIPTIFAGIPLRVRSLDVNIDKDGFLRNQSGCDQRSLNTVFTSSLGIESNSSVPLATSGCDALPFSPDLRIVAGGKGLTKVGIGPNLKAIVTQTNGEAANLSSLVALPEIFRPNLPAIQKLLCPGDQFVAGTCPASLQVGTVRVRTPVLPEPLVGAIYLGQKPGQILPDLGIQLAGSGVGLQLFAGNRISGVRTINEFHGLPDVPISEFVLELNGGKNGIIKNFRDLCTSKGQHADATFTGQNGKTFTSAPALEVEGCGSASQLGATISGKRVRVSKKGVAPVRVTCPDGDTCEGTLTLRKGKKSVGKKSFEIDGGKSKTVRVKLSKAGKRAVKRGKLKVKATAKLSNDASTSKTLTLSKAKRKR